LSAAEALQELNSACQKPISTGLRSLDAILEGKEPDQAPRDGATGGLARGQVAEIWGPAGVGKTAFAYVILLFIDFGVIIHQSFIKLLFQKESTQMNVECR
jgi:hypothetical protein